MSRNSNNNVQDDGDDDANADDLIDSTLPTTPTQPWIPASVDVSGDERQPPREAARDSQAARGAKHGSVPDAGMLSRRGEGWVDGWMDGWIRTLIPDTIWGMNEILSLLSLSLSLSLSRFPSFRSQMFQWATTISTSGQNLPLALPLKVDKTAKVNAEDRKIDLAR